jgi:hypothetical protein
MRFKVMSKSMKVLVLAGVLLFVAVSAVQAGGKPIGSDFHAKAVPAGNTGQSVASGTARSGQIPRFWHPVLAGGRIVGSDFHASAAPACGDKCPVLAGGASGAGGDIRASLTGQVPSLWRPMLASEEGLGSGGDQSGRGATGGRGGISGDV